MRKLLHRKVMHRRFLKNRFWGICILLAAGVLAAGGTQEAKADSSLEGLPHFTAGTIRSLALTQEGEEIFRISNEPADYKMDFDYWEILNPYDENATVDTEAMYGLFEAVAAFDFSEETEAETGADSGIEDTGTWITVEFVSIPDTENAADTENTADAAKDTDAAERADSTEATEHSVTILIGNEDGEGKVYAAVQGQEEQVYKLPAEAVASVFNLSPFDYILKIPVLFNIETLDYVEIVINENSYHMKIEDGAYFLGKEKVEKEKFTTLYQALMNVFLDSEIKEESDGEQTEVLRIAFHRNTDTAPDVELVYRTFNDTFHSLSVNGKEQFLVKAEDVETLVRQIEDAF